MNTSDTALVANNIIGKAHRSVTRTVRIDEDVDQMFQELADREKVSTNHLVNKALRRYGEWEVLAERYGFVTISNRMLGVLFERLTIEEARKMGREAGGPSTAEFIQFYFKKFNYDTTMRTLELLGHQYARNYTFEKSGEGNEEMIIMKHGRGAKTSAYMAEGLKSVFGQLGMKIDVMETEDQIVARIPRKQTVTAAAR
jgi:hypothetical protein